MLSAIGHIILTDFGSAKRLDDGQKTATLAGTYSHGSNMYLISSSILHVLL